MLDRIKKNWDYLYGETKYLNKLIDLLNERKKENEYIIEDKTWYQKGTVYSIYVDLFAENFSKLTEKLDYLQDLGVNILWLLPILKSPMVDQGFDISDYYQIRKDLGTNQDFINFINTAHDKGIKILFDIAVNHTSNQHKWFKNGRQSHNTKYRDFYIWNDDTDKYNKTRLLLKGVSNSNWTYNEKTDDYYFHRFYDIQPDLNYKNPQVLYEMIKAFTYWKTKGVDGFRMDAIPFLWKKEGTNCENLKETHIIIKIFRAAFDYIEKGTVMIAEANQMPEDVIEYLGDGDECHVVYNFPIMPRIFLAMAENDASYIKKQIDIINSFDQPKNTAWFTFLRCHDELTLEFVNEEERKLMNQHYLRDDKWTFREGEGISGRLYDILSKDVQKVLLAYSLLFSIKGTPIIYFGDEIGMENDIDFYNKMNQKYGYKDSRFLNRGYFDQKRKNIALNKPESDPGQIYRGLKDMINLKRENDKLFKSDPKIEIDNNVIISTRKTEDKKLIMINNISENNYNYKGFEVEQGEYNWILEENI